MLDKLYHWLKLFCNRQINCKLTTIISYCGMKNEKKMKFYQTNYYSDTFKLIHYLIRIIVQWYDKLNYFIDSFQSVTRNTRPNFFFWYFSLYLRFLSMNSLNSSTKKKRISQCLEHLYTFFSNCNISFPFKIISRFVNSKIMIWLDV